MAKYNKRALLLSVLALMLCAAMLIGTTYAWFTDTATAGVNRIQSGTLNVVLEMKDNDGKWVSAEGKTPIKPFLLLMPSTILIFFLPTI